MRKLLGAFAAAVMAMCANSTSAQQATVYSGCGLQSWATGFSRGLGMTTGGDLCVSGSIGTVTTVTTVGTITNPVGVKGADGSTITSTSNPVPTAVAPLTSGGLSTYSGNVTTAGTGAGTGGVAVKASAGQVYGYMVWNGNSSVCYISFFDQTQALTNLGTTVPKLAIGIPALGGANLTGTVGIPFATAITISATTTRNGSTACSTGLDINVLYF